MKSPSLLLFSSFCAVLVVANGGCGSDEAPAGKAGSSGKGGSSGKAGASGTGGTSGGGGTGGTSGTSGTGGTGGTGGAGGTGGTAPCTTGAMRCNGNTRESCTSTGTWQALPTTDQCSGATPTCTGAGVCAAYQLSGQIDTFGPYSALTNGPTYILREQTLLEYPKVCGSTYCVSGGIKP